LTAERSRYATGVLRICALAAVTGFVAACTAASDPSFGTLSPSFMAVPGAASVLDVQASAPSSASSAPTTATVGAVAKPKLERVEPSAEVASAKADEPKTSVAAETATSTTAPDTGFYLTAADPAAAAPVSAKKRSFLSSFFGSTPAQAAPLADTSRPTQPLVQLASASPAKAKSALAALDDEEDLNPLPGVRQTALFEIRRRSGIDDDSDVDLHEGDDDGGIYQVASAAGLARLAPNGLLKQTERVDIGCLKPSLVRTLKAVERHYGKKVVVTSGYRNREHNRRARGAKNSLHMYCAAADVQVPGISKWELAKYVRSMPGRGGVGTYCHTESVHIDVGPERDWNWRCRRRKG
jgi:uncharacterized protein YcbK (DUF882 family)